MLARIVNKNKVVILLGHYTFVYFMLWIFRHISMQNNYKLSYYLSIHLYLINTKFQDSFFIHQRFNSVPIFIQQEYQ